MKRASEDGFTVVEVVVTAAILVVALAVVGNYIISATRSVAQSTAQENDNAAARRVVDQLENNIRFACNMVISGGTLYVANAYGTCLTPGQPACAEWSSSAGALNEKTASGTATVASGVTGLTFTGNAAYNGLVTMQFTVRQPQDQAGDPAGVSMDQTLTARNMSLPVASGVPLIGCP